MVSTKGDDSKDGVGRRKDEKKEPFVDWVLRGLTVEDMRFVFFANSTCSTVVDSSQIGFAFVAGSRGCDFIIEPTPPCF